MNLNGFTPILLKEKGKEMNDSVRGVMREGSAWTARIGIRGIRAARIGQEASRAFAEELSENLGAFQRLTHIQASTDLPPMHIMEVDRMVIIWAAVS